MAPYQPKRKRGGPKDDSKTNLKPTLTCVLSLYPVRDQFCRMVPISDLISLTRTCRQLSSLYRSILPTRWNTDKRLKDFVQDPKGLRTQMAIHDALISGSFAIQFFEGLKWTESDLDIFVESGLDAIEMQQYLVSMEGYSVCNLRDRDDEGYFAMSKIVKVRLLKWACSKLQHCWQVQCRSWPWQRTDPIQRKPWYNLFVRRASQSSRYWAASTWPWLSMWYRGTRPMPCFRSLVLSTTNLTFLRRWAIMSASCSPSTMAEDGNVAIFCGPRMRPPTDRWSWTGGLEINIRG